MWSTICNNMYPSFKEKIMHLKCLISNINNKKFIKVL